MNEETKQEYAGTNATGDVDILGIAKGNVDIKTQNRCPSGYYWVKTYKRQHLLGSTTVQGHCRKAGSFEEEQRTLQDQAMKMQEQKNEIKL